MDGETAVVRQAMLVGVAVLALAGAASAQTFVAIGAGGPSGAWDRGWPRFSTPLAIPIGLLVGLWRSRG